MSFHQQLAEKDARRRGLAGNVVTEENSPQNLSRDYPASDDDIVDTAEAARILKLKPNTLAKWRCNGQGPRAYKAGLRRVVYKRRELMAWLEGQAIS